MRVAIVGTGVSGLVAAHLLHGSHDVTVFEASDRIGGHVNTVDVTEDGRAIPVDTGFIVYNERTYPLFTALIRGLGVATRESTMSFSVRCERSGLEYNGGSIGGLFAAPANLFRPAFLRMIREIFRFNRAARLLARRHATAAGSSVGTTLREILETGRYSREFVEHYLVPMGAAIWSMPPRRLLEFPALFFARFFENHGFLSIGDRPTWRVIRGGSRTYVEALIRPFRDRVRLATPVRRVRRAADRVTVDGERFDQVVFACHSDQALATLADPSAAETAVLSALPYQANDAVLHTDTRLLPRRPRARAAWNAHVGVRGRSAAETEEHPVALTYDMNRLQSLEARETYCVTLNRSEDVDERRRIASFRYRHPVTTRDAVAARERWRAVSGVNRTHYCGAYWGYGFHEDGVRSAADVARRFGAGFP